MTDPDKNAEKMYKMLQKLVRVTEKSTTQKRQLRAKRNGTGLSTKKLQEFETAQKAHVAALDGGGADKELLFHFGFAGFALTGEDVFSGISRHGRNGFWI